MLDIQKIKESSPNILILGNHKKIIQSILDYDYIVGKKVPSVKGIISGGSKKNEKFFWGEKEVLISKFETCLEAKNNYSKNNIDINLFINIKSGRSCKQYVDSFFKAFPNALGGHIFAEDTPEQHSVDIYNKYQKEGKFIIGPSGVGLLIPGHLKLGAIGGTDYRQILRNKIQIPGNVAVLSASGGMAIELITMLSNVDKRLSFAITFGGDRFPITQPLEAVLEAEKDPTTDTIIYYGELGGHDEYEIIDLIKKGKLNKKIIAYIAGSVSEAFKGEEIQFGHAKAISRSEGESAKEKIEALKKAGVEVAGNIEELQILMKNIVNKNQIGKDKASLEKFNILENRNIKPFTTTMCKESKEGYKLLGKPLEEFAKEGTFGEKIVSTILGHEPKSKLLIDFSEHIFKMVIDHGAQVSGAVNTIVTARAGKDLVSSLCSGLLTIGPRFGGAVNEAAFNWHKGVTEKWEAKDFLEQYKKEKKIALGIGHKKYRVGIPDPRLKALEIYVEKIENPRFLNFAREIEKITTSKKGNLILNVDGFIAAVLMDILSEKEGYTDKQISELISYEFFNAYFVIPRSIGFIGHYMDQKKLGMGLFRLDESQISYL